MKKIFYSITIFFSLVLLSQVLISESYGLSTTYMGDIVSEYTKGIDNRHLAKKAVLNELEKRIQFFDEENVVKIKQELDKMPPINDFHSIEAPEYQVFVIYNYYALKGEYTMYAIGVGSNLFSPLRQAKEMDPKHGIICYNGLELVFKISDSSTACVTFETAEKLIKRGWANAQ